MKKVFNLKPVYNKSNGQINFNLPKKSLSPQIKQNIQNIRNFKFKLEGWN